MCLKIEIQLLNVPKLFCGPSSNTVFCHPLAPVGYLGTMGLVE